jgi:hypothetical protein
MSMIAADNGHAERRPSLHQNPRALLQKRRTNWRRRVVSPPLPWGDISVKTSVTSSVEGASGGFSNVLLSMTPQSPARSLLGFIC